MVQSRPTENFEQQQWPVRPNLSALVVKQHFKPEQSSERCVYIHARLAEPRLYVGSSLVLSIKVIALCGAFDCPVDPEHGAVASCRFSRKLITVPFAPGCRAGTMFTDVDAAYAQFEMSRLKIPKDKPVAVQQWQGLIAVNYPARKFGISRHETVTEAKKKCPDLIAIHVATYKDGEEEAGYWPDAVHETHKVRLQSAFPEEFQHGGWLTGSQQTAGLFGTL